VPNGIKWYLDSALIFRATGYNFLLEIFKMMAPPNIGNISSDSQYIAIFADSDRNMIQRELPGKVAEDLNEVSRIRRKIQFQSN
jgi:hypothetical protein